jgi:hypothetical protein
MVSLPQIHRTAASDLNPTNSVVEPPRREQEHEGFPNHDTDLTVSSRRSIDVFTDKARKPDRAIAPASFSVSLLLARPAASADAPPQGGIVPLLTSDGLSAATITVATLFLLAVLLESALAIVFNWRPFIESFNARATRPLVSFAVALAFVVYFNFDAVTGLMNAVEKPQTQLSPNWLGYLLTAAILAGGSAGVNTMLVALGFRELKTQETASPKLDLTQAWVAVRVLQEKTAGEVRVQIGDPGAQANLPLAGIIPGSANKTSSPFRRFFLRDPGRFPPFGGYVVPSKQPCRIVVSGVKKDDRNYTRVPADPVDFTPAERAIIDLTINL